MWLEFVGYGGNMISLQALLLVNSKETLHNSMPEHLGPRQCQGGVAPWAGFSGTVA